MEIQQNKVTYSDIQLNIEVNHEEEKHVQDSLQRTEVWFEERRGNWTASQFKSLMSSNSSGGKLDWFDKQKVFLFSEGSIKYIFANAMERKTGRYITSDSTKEMKYGTKIEPLIEKRFGLWLVQHGLSFKKVGFKTFDDIPTAGVSSDGIVLDGLKGIVASAEFKACSSWTTLFDRTYELMDETGKDFWQTQGQMEAWNVKKNYYVVISPPKDINRYLYCEDINEMYEEWIAETEMEIQILNRSDIHCAALVKRIKIAESTVERFLSEADSEQTIKEILYEEIEWHKDYWNGDANLTSHVSAEETETAMKKLASVLGSHRNPPSPPEPQEPRQLKQGEIPKKKLTVSYPKVDPDKIIKSEPIGVDQYGNVSNSSEKKENIFARKNRELAEAKEAAPVQNLKELIADNSSHEHILEIKTSSLEEGTKEPNMEDLPF